MRVNYGRTCAVCPRVMYRRNSKNMKCTLCKDAMPFPPTPLNANINPKI